MVVRIRWVLDILYSFSLEIARRSIINKVRVLQAAQLSGCIVIGLILSSASKRSLSCLRIGCVLVQSLIWLMLAMWTPLAMRTRAQVLMSMMRSALTALHTRSHRRDTIHRDWS